MRMIGSLISAVFGSFTPDGTMARNRFRARLDAVVTAIVALLAIVLAVGYQVFRLWARWTEGGD